MISLGNLIGIPFWTGSGLVKLPTCISTTAVSWFKDLNSTSKTYSTVYAIDDVIGERTDEVYYGQYLDATSGQINFYRTEGTFDYTDPSDGTLVEGISIPGTGLYTIPANGICEIGVYPRDMQFVPEVFKSDGNDYVNLSSIPDILGDSVISFKLYVPSSTITFGNFIILISNGGSDMFSVDVFDKNTLRACANGLLGYTNGIATYDISSLKDIILNVTIVKTTRAIVSITINEIEETNYFSTGLFSTNAAYFANAANVYIWDININDEHHYKGYTNGNTDSAWLDTIGSIDGTIVGDPTVINIGTKGDTIYLSKYPICERAGTVLHDVMSNSTHISVDTPVWAESLYGSDYLNQYGYVNKEDNDALNNTVEGLLDFDGVDDSIQFTGIDPTGTKFIELNMYLTKDTGYSATGTGNMVFKFSNGTSDYIALSLYNDQFYVTTTSTGFGNPRFPISGYSDKIIKVRIEKTTGAKASLYIDNVLQTESTSVGGVGAGSEEYSLGSFGYTNYLVDAYVWDVNFNDEHSWSGYPDGDQNSAWEDSIGSIDGIVYGSPTTTNITIYDYSWETDVDGSPVTLDDDTLIPLRQE